jgi:hypothetical protein
LEVKGKAGFVLWYKACFSFFAFKGKRDIFERTFLMACASKKDTKENRKAGIG